MLQRHLEQAEARADRAEQERAVAHDAGLEAFARAQAAEARADLAEARLGHIADACLDFAPAYRADPTLVPGSFYEAVVAAKAWTPDDTATAGSVCPSTGNPDDGADCSCWDDDTATAGADTTGDGSTLPRVLEYRTKEAPDGGE
jgi:hypothetical protein